LGADFILIYDNLAQPMPEPYELNLNYLKPDEACVVLRVCRNTLKDMIDDGRVKAVDRRKPGGKYAKWLIFADSLHNPTDPTERIALGEIERGLGW
jgi:hypothetical protein